MSSNWEVGQWCEWWRGGVWMLDLVIESYYLLDGQIDNVH